jgi:hypothetical protein
MYVRTPYIPNGGFEPTTYLLGPDFIRTAARSDVDLQEA